MGLLGGLLGEKKEEKKIQDVRKKDEMLRDEMIKKIRQNMNATESDRRDATENRKVEKRVAEERDDEIDEAMDDEEEEDEYTDTNDLISSLKGKVEQDTAEMCNVLSAAIEEQGDVKAAELLALGRTILHNISGGR